MGFATPKFGGDFKPYPQTLKDGSNIQRVLPPILSCEANGLWAKPTTTHTYSTPKAGGDGKKRNWYTFLCVEKISWQNGEKVVLQKCPECESIKAHKEQYEEIKKDLTLKVRDGVMTKAAASDALRPHLNWSKAHGRDFKYHVNAKTSDGKFGTFKYPSGVKKEIDEFIEEYGKLRLPINPIVAEQGLWLNINKTPKEKTPSGFPEYKTTVVMDEVEQNGSVAMVPKKGPLSEADYQAACAQCLDLGDLGYRRLSVEQVQALVDANDEPEVIDAIFKGTDKGEVSPASQAAQAHKATPTAPAAPQPAVVRPAAPPPPPPAAAPKQSNIEAEMEALREKARALLAQADGMKTAPAANEQMKSSAPPRSTPVAPSPVPAGDDGPDLGALNEEFFAEFDVG